MGLHTGLDDRDSLSLETMEDRARSDDYGLSPKATLYEDIGGLVWFRVRSSRLASIKQIATMLYSLSDLLMHLGFVEMVQAISLMELGRLLGLCTSDLVRLRKYSAGSSGMVCTNVTQTFLEVSMFINHLNPSFDPIWQVRLQLNQSSKKHVRFQNILIQPVKFNSTRPSPFQPLLSTLHGVSKFTNELRLDSSSNHFTSS